MKKTVLGVSIFVGFLGLLSVILGFAAEANRIKRDDVKLVNGKCKYNDSPAFGLGLAAALLLLLGQILISSFAGCICCCKKRPPEGKICTGVTCYVISWVTFVLAFLLLLSGAILSSSYTTDARDDANNDRECFVLPHGIFTGGAVLSFATFCLGIAYYLIASSATHPDTPLYNHGIAMGHPLPQMSAAPAFVYEDTYRKQYP